MEDIKSNATAELRKIPKEASTGTSNSGWTDGANVCAQRSENLWTARRNVKSLTHVHFLVIIFRVLQSGELIQL
jgi:hypothetical protein